MLANLYKGTQSGKWHLEVGGITLATEGDLCRDATYRRMLRIDCWDESALRTAYLYIRTLEIANMLGA